jgi:hypothetical protein
MWWIKILSRCLYRWKRLHQVNEDTFERFSKLRLSSSGEWRHFRAIFKDEIVLIRWMKTLSSNFQAWDCLHQVNEDTFEQFSKMRLSSSGEWRHFRAIFKDEIVLIRWMKTLSNNFQKWDCLHNMDDDNHWPISRRPKKGLVIPRNDWIFFL